MVFDIADQKYGFSLNPQTMLNTYGIRFSFPSKKPSPPFWLKMDRVKFQNKLVN
jgi:hypothetical protein